MRRPKTVKHLVAERFEALLADAPRAEPACPHFGDCGGCAYQDIRYPDLVETKRRVCLYLSEYAQAADLLEGVAVDAFASPRPYGYRQRMDYVCAFGSAGLRRRKRNRQVVPLESCVLLGPEGFAAFRRATELARAAEWPFYDYMKHVGDLRYVVVRQTRSGQRLISLVTKTDGFRRSAAAVAGALLAEGRAHSVHWLLAPGQNDVSFGDPIAHWGAPHIAETLGGMTFRLGPNTFFQANPWVAEQAYADLAAHAAAAPDGPALDLYSGTGVIASFLARAGRDVTAVENVPDNVALAAENFRANAIGTVTMVGEDAGAWLRARAEAVAAGTAERPALAVVNPPRPGMDPAGTEALATLGPARILYLSCNAATLWRDAKALSATYRVTWARVYDMFPQTPHFETLAVLDRR